MEYWEIIVRCTFVCVITEWNYQLILKCINMSRYILACICLNVSRTGNAYLHLESEFYPVYMQFSCSCLANLRRVDFSTLFFDRSISYIYVVYGHFFY